MLTTHYLEEADALADRIVVINSGQIVAEGTPSEIKGKVGAKRVRFRSGDVDDARLATLPGVQRATCVGDMIEVYTLQPEALLATLFAEGATIHELEVVGAGLEEAFLSLTAGHEGVIQ